ncbi:MAG: quinone oxidoreductase [Candidatus Lambdaproteobacteria bacterium]|nr:quinone oxidoreductase [Candidatus Lambdaproteobacteria bacterium]
MKAIWVTERGDASRLQYRDLPTPHAGAQEVLVRLEAIGVNFLDILQRQGSYWGPLPYVPGQEGCGIVEAVGGEVRDLRVGQRVCFSQVLGSYAEYIAFAAVRAVPVPEGVEPQVAVGAMIQGMTAHYLVFDTYRVQPGDWVLVHAAAGGTGRLVVQAAKSAGATVIATVSSDDKAPIAREAGADHVINYAQQDFAAAARALPGFKKLAAVYDSVGQATFEQGLGLLRRRGMMVVYGRSSGPVEPYDINKLNPLGSLFLTRPNLFDYVYTRKDLLVRAGAVFEMLRDGRLSVLIGKTYPLAEAAAAQSDLEARHTTGKLVLLP